MVIICLTFSLTDEVFIKVTFFFHYFIVTHAKSANKSLQNLHGVWSLLSLCVCMGAILLLPSFLSFRCRVYILHRRVEGWESTCESNLFCRRVFRAIALNLIEFLDFPWLIHTITDRTPTDGPHGKRESIHQFHQLNPTTLSDTNVFIGEPIAISRCESNGADRTVNFLQVAVERVRHILRAIGKTEGGSHSADWNHDWLRGVGELETICQCIC